MTTAIRTSASDQSKDTSSGLKTCVLRLPTTDEVTIGVLRRAGRVPDKSIAPTLLVHGATLGAALFDLALPGYSAMGALADGGGPVYALDVRGYGHSLNGQVMDAPADMHPPYARIGDAVKDIGAAVDFILASEKASALNLVGFSWGTVSSARYAGENPDKVARLVLYAPLYAEHNSLWLDRIADPADRSRLNPKIGAYRLVTQEDILQRWSADIDGDPDLCREPGVAEAIFEALARLDSQTSSHKPEAFRSPTGALADLIGVFNGHPLYDPATITMPTLLVRGSDDTTSTDSDTKNLFAAIAARRKVYEVIAPGSHFLCVEKNRAKLYQAIKRFFEQD
jgi:pimeloyl-ACP methyl ester carboxylesterase